MQRVKFLWNAFKDLAILLSFIVNVVLIIVLLVVVMQLFQIKNGIAEPLIDGLHASFVGLDEATIDRVIPVRDEIPISFDLPLNQGTTVVLTAPVPLTVAAQFNLPGGGGRINGTVAINLPQGLELPVMLNLDVPVETTVPVNLDVRAVIPLRETQLHDAFANLQGLLEPFVMALDNLPSNADEGWAYVGQLVSGNAPDLLTPTEGSEHPWPGFSHTAGEGYGWPLDTPPQPGQTTGIEPGGLGGWTIPAGAPDGVYEPVYINGLPVTRSADQAPVSASQPVEGMAPAGEESAAGEGAPAVEEAPTVEEAPAGEDPPASDLGIIQVTPAP